jgi:hypothetical protein
MSHPTVTNAGLRPQDLARKQFQTAIVVTVNKQAEAIQLTREFVADLSTRLDVAQAKQTTFEARSWRQRLRWLVFGR